MGTTANYSWPTPVATDLVKDGWEAIKDLGDAADTTVKAVSDAQGLVHINTTAFSAVSSQSIDDVFSNDYFFYRILFTASGSTTDQALNFRLRVSGSDNSSTNYHRQSILANGTGSTIGRFSSETSWVAALGSINSTAQNLNIFEIQNPFQTQHTSAYRLSVGNASDGSNIVWTSVAFGLTVTTSYTGFTFYPASGTMTGSISVYGYRKN